MPSDSVIASIVSTASRSLSDPADVAVPESLRGRLASAADSSGASAALCSVADVVFRSAKDAPLRTSPGFLEAISGRVRAARSERELSVSANELVERLRATGAYKAVTPSLEESVGGAARLVVGLEEMSYSLKSGVDVSPNHGRLRVTNAASLINAFGAAETLSVSLGSGSGNVPVDSADFFSPLRADGPQLAPLSVVERTREALTGQDFFAELSAPALRGTGASAYARIRSNKETLEVGANYDVKFSEAEVGVTDATRHHTLSAGIALRQPAPTPVRGSAALFAPTVSASVAEHCNATTKHALRYAYSNNKMRPSSAAPSSGHDTRFHAELAGLGGDVKFAKLTFNASYAASLGRFAPDTGFSLPDTDGTPARPPTAPLVTHPGSGVLRWWTGRGLRPLDGSAGARGGWLSHLGAWLSPGVSAVFDVLLGAQIPFGAEPRRGSPLPDRFFSQNLNKLRGFSSIGVRAPLEGGRGSDSLGGDFALVATARLLLPPPIPLASISNSGARSYVFASAGSLLLRDDHRAWSDVASSVCYSAGVGLVSVER